MPVNYETAFQQLIHLKIDHYIPAFSIESIHKVQELKLTIRVKQEEMAQSVSSRVSSHMLENIGRTVAEAAIALQETPVGRFQSNCVGFFQTKQIRTATDIFFAGIVTLRPNGFHHAKFAVRIPKKGRFTFVGSGSMMLEPVIRQQNVENKISSNPSASVATPGDDVSQKFMFISCRTSKPTINRELKQELDKIGVKCHKKVGWTASYQASFLKTSERFTYTFVVQGREDCGKMTEHVNRIKEKWFNLFDVDKMAMHAFFWTEISEKDIAKIMLLAQHKKKCSNNDEIDLNKWLNDPEILRLATSPHKSHSDSKTIEEKLRPLMRKRGAEIISEIVKDFHKP